MLVITLQATLSECIPREEVTNTTNWRASDCSRMAWKRKNPYKNWNASWPTFPARACVFRSACAQLCVVRPAQLTPHAPCYCCLSSSTMNSLVSSLRLVARGVPQRVLVARTVVPRMGLVVRGFATRRGQTSECFCWYGKFCAQY